MVVVDLDEVVASATHRWCAGVVVNFTVSFAITTSKKLVTPAVVGDDVVAATRSIVVAAYESVIVSVAA